MRHRKYLLLECIQYFPQTWAREVWCLVSSGCSPSPWTPFRWGFHTAKAIGLHTAYALNSRPCSWYSEILCPNRPDSTPVAFPGPLPRFIILKADCSSSSIQQAWRVAKGGLFIYVLWIVFGFAEWSIHTFSHETACLGKAEVEKEAEVGSRWAVASQPSWKSEECKNLAVLITVKVDLSRWEGRAHISEHFLSLISKSNI